VFDTKINNSFTCFMEEVIDFHFIFIV
jgi:hypothetical protein